MRHDPTNVIFITDDAGFQVILAEGRQIAVSTRIELLLATVC